MARPEWHNERFENHLVITNSLGVRGVRQAGGLIVLCGAEPTGLMQTTRGTIAVERTDYSNRESGIDVRSRWKVAAELLYHPITTVRSPFDVRYFSALAHMYELGNDLGELQMYFQFKDDEYGFCRPDYVEYAKHLGMTAGILEGYHNESLYRPSSTLRQIAAHISETTQADPADAFKQFFS